MELIERLRKYAPAATKPRVAAIMEEAADRLAAMKAAGDGLERFVQDNHHDECEVFVRRAANRPCDCGLIDAIQKWKDASHD